jgi:hypothetical protein
MAGGELSTTGSSMDSVLAKDYPRPIRELYTGVLRKDHPSERHRQLLRLGEAGLTHLAALAFADYRRLRGGEPVPEVAAAVGAMERLTAGDYLRLFPCQSAWAGSGGDLRDPQI